MNWKLLALFLCFNFLFLITTNAQSYKQAIGLRITPSSAAVTTGVNYRYFIKEKAALEGIVSFADGFGICGLYEIHNPTSLENLNWFYGAGGYVSSHDKQTYVGGTGIIGVDYKFPQLPLNISFDWKPELNIIDRFYFEGATVGFAARFTF